MNLVFLCSYTFIFLYSGPLHEFVCLQAAWEKSAPIAVFSVQRRALKAQ